MTNYSATSKMLRLGLGGFKTLNMKGISLCVFVLYVTVFIFIFLIFVIYMDSDTRIECRSIAKPMWSLICTVIASEPKEKSLS